MLRPTLHFFFIGSHPSSGIYGILGQTLQLLLPLVPHELIREDVRESVFWSNTIRGERKLEREVAAATTVALFHELQRRLP